MTEFTASNGIRIWVTPGYYTLHAQDSEGTRQNFGHPLEAALREFFQHKRDEALGRWRWPENPDYVVYPPEAGFVMVLHEPTAKTTVYERAWHRIDSDADVAARAYFDAHPETKPWEDAISGEVWELTLRDGSKHLARAGFGDFSHLFEFTADFSMSKKHMDITAGRRVWPEGGTE